MFVVFYDLKCFRGLPIFDEHLLNQPLETASGSVHVAGFAAAQRPAYLHISVTT